MCIQTEVLILTDKMAGNSCVQVCYASLTECVIGYIRNSAFLRNGNLKKRRAQSCVQRERKTERDRDLCTNHEVPCPRIRLVLFSARDSEYREHKTRQPSGVVEL